MPGSRVPLWWWWIGIVLAVSFPWNGVAPHPQWSRVHWVPLADPADKLSDLIANIALFLPFGYSFTGRGRGGLGGRILGAVAAALAVSVCAEATQLFGRHRYPSATDVTAACVGALAGAAWRVAAGRSEPV